MRSLYVCLQREFSAAAAAAASEAALRLAVRFSRRCRVARSMMRSRRQDATMCTTVGWGGAEWEGKRWSATVIGSRSTGSAGAWAAWGVEGVGAHAEGTQPQAGMPSETQTHSRAA